MALINLLLLLCFLVFLCILNWFVLVSCITFNATVNLDGSADYKTINEAIAKAPDSSNTRFYIRVKAGIYNERIIIPSKKTFIALVGDDALTTIIVDDRSNGTGYKTYDTATFTVRGDNFMAKSLTFQNSAGPQNHQAVAVLDQAKQSTYYKCIFLGFQDTLYAKGRLQFFKKCDIYGTVDFIFGDGLAMFQDCNIFARLPSNTITITAQSKIDPKFKIGYSFQNCTITVASELGEAKGNVSIFLGRPWRNYSTVVFMESFLDDVVVPRGWLEWPGVPVDLLFYGEFHNRGPGADVSKRVNWPDFHILDEKVAINFTVENFINRTTWLPEGCRRICEFSLVK